MAVVRVLGYQRLGKICKISKGAKDHQHKKFRFCGWGRWKAEMRVRMPQQGVRSLADGPRVLAERTGFAAAHTMRFSSGKNQLGQGLGGWIEWADGLDGCVKGLVVFGL